MQTRSRLLVAKQVEGRDEKGVEGVFWECCTCSVSYCDDDSIGYIEHVDIHHMSKFIRFYTLNMYSLLYISNTSIIYSKINGIQ